MRIRFTGLGSLLLLASLTGCRAADAPWHGGEEWIRTELFFGLAKPTGGMVSDAEWERFLDTSVTPRFPNGFSVLHAQGRYLMADQTLQKEPARMLIILHPLSSRDADEKIDGLVREYIQRFEQESVLRSDSTARSGLIFARPSNAVKKDELAR